MGGPVDQRCSAQSIAKYPIKNLFLKEFKMQRTSLLKAAVESLTAGVPAPIGQPVPPEPQPAALPAEQRVEELEGQNAQLSQELIESEEIGSNEVVDRTSDKIDDLVQATESLLVLQSLIGDAVRTRNCSAHANSGFAMALESICTNVQIGDALVTAGLEADAAATGDAPTEEDKGKGLFAAAREKLKQVWDYLVQLGKRIITMIKSASYRTDNARDIEKLNDLIARVKNIERTDVKGKITDPAFCKAMRVGKNSSMNQVMIATGMMLEKMIDYTKAYGTVAKSALTSLNNPTDAARESVRTAVVRLATQLAQIIKPGATDADTEVSSGPLLCGINVHFKRQFEEGKLPKMDVTYTVDDTDYSNELDVASKFDAERVEVAWRFLNSASTQSLLSDLVPVAENMQSSVPSTWLNVDNIADVQMYASAAMGLVAKHTLQLQNLVFGLLLHRWIWASIRWFTLSLKEVGSAEPAAA